MNERPLFVGVVAADAHIDRFNRIDDFARCFDFIIQTTIDRKLAINHKYACGSSIPFHFQFGGDAYKTWHPAPIEMSIFHRLKKLADYGIGGSIVVGNHDTPESEDSRGVHCFTEIKTLGFALKVKDEPSIEALENGGEVVGSYIYIPHLPKAVLQRAGATYAEYFKYILDSLIGQCQAGAPIVLLTHCYLKEAAVGPADLVIEGDRQISVKDLADPRLTAVLLGDIHKAQRLMEKPLILYPGSIDRIDFGEADEPKGFVYYEVWGPQDIRVEFIPTPARRFVHIVADLSPNQTEGSRFFDVPDKPSDIQPWLEAKLKDYDLKGAIVKVTIRCGQSQKGQVDDRRLSDLLVKYGAERVRSVSYDMNEAKLQRAPEITEGLDPVAALEKWIGTQDYPPVTKEKMMVAGKNLIGAIK